MPDTSDDWRDALRRHEQDDSAHPHMIRTFVAGEIEPWKVQDERWKDDVGKRLTYLEKAWWMCLGGMIVISTLLAAGALTFLVHVLTTK